MDRVNGSNAFPKEEDWYVLTCVHNIVLTEQCDECVEDAGNSPRNLGMGELAPDGLNVVRTRTFQSTVPDCPFLLGTGKCASGCLGPDGPACWEPADVSRETTQAFQCSHRGQISGQCTLCGRRNVL
jgi:hypothetical protein